MKKLFAFNASAGRNGDIAGLFISTEEEVTAVVGTDVYFGEILGKHSSVEIILKPEHFRVVEVSISTVEDLHNTLGDTVSGYNPFDYIETMPDEYDQDEQISLLR